MAELPEHTVSSGNVFEDLGMPDADEMLVKAELVLQISRIIEEEGLTQVEAAELLGVDQPKVSALLRGRLRGFSVERLTRFLNALGQDVEIVVRPKPRAAERAFTRVTSRRRNVSTTGRRSSESR
jgi:predicted XRE-type DNA-binding protein